MHPFSKICGPFLLSLLVLLSACGKPDIPAFNEEAMLFNAVLIPGEPENVAVDREFILQALTDLAPPWREAGDSAHQALLAENSPLSIKIAGREDMVFPGVRYLVNFGVGLEPNDILRCSTAQQAVQLFVRCPAAEVPRLYPMFQAITLAVATRLGGYIFDENAKIILTPVAYGQDVFSPDTSPLRTHLLLQQYPLEPGRFRIVTLGMAKFGAPEVECRDYPPDKALVFKKLTGAVARRLIQASLAGSPFPETLDLAPADLEEPLEMPLTAAVPPGDAALTVHLLTGWSEDGDPQSNIVRPAPPEDASADAGEWGRRISRFMFGIDIETIVWQGDLPAETETARAALPDFKRDFLTTDSPADGWYVRFRAQPPGSMQAELLVARVEKWTDDNLGVLLLSEPQLAAGAGAGSRISVPDSEVVDWIRVTPAGEVHGDYLKNLR
jgi:hypothetical protein